MKTKLTICEQRAEKYCAQLIANDGGTVAVDWKKSAMYGMNPVIESTVRDALAKQGWKLAKSASGKTYDVYDLSRIA